MPKGIRAVLLDVDGTLIDSNDAHARAWVDALKEADIDVPFERVRQLIGMGGDKLLPAVSGIEEDSDAGRRIGERRKAIFLNDHLPHVKCLPGTRALLDRLEDAGYQLVVATSAKSDELASLLAVAQATELASNAATSSDADESKPDPDIIQAALKRAGCRPDEAVMVGDTPYDIEAATRAGVSTVALRSGGWDDAALSGAIARYDDPADLLARFDASPFGQGAAESGTQVCRSTR